MRISLVTQTLALSKVGWRYLKSYHKVSEPILWPFILYVLGHVIAEESTTDLGITSCYIPEPLHVAVFVN